MPSPRNDGSFNLGSSLKNKSNTLIKNQQMILLGYDDDSNRAEDQEAINNRKINLNELQSLLV